MVSTICKSTEEGGQQGYEINEDGFQTHFEAKVLEKIDIKGNFENDKLGMKFKECVEIKECKDMEKVDPQESMLEHFELEEENQFQVNEVYNENDDKITPQHRSNVNKTVYTANELCKDKDQDSYETQIYSTQSEKNKSTLNNSFLNVPFLSKKEEDFQKDRPSVIQVNNGASLCNPVDPHLNETKKYSSLSKKVQNFQKD